MRRNANKSKMIVFLCITLLFMGIGYAVLQSNLNISGTAKSTGTFGVQITNVLETQDSIDNGGVSSKTEEHTTTTATFVTEFTAPGDYVEYKLTVSNIGTIDAVISANINDSDNEVDGNNNPYYIFTAIDEDNLDITKYRDELNVGESKEITVKIKFNEKATNFPNKNVTFTLTINAIQKATSDYNPEEREATENSSCFVSVIPGEINYYDTNNPECGSEVEIPSNLKLKTTEVTNIEFDSAKCMSAF